ncbi:MAG: hypothetical protein ACE5FO_12525 [Parvularculaceae bacterium]
MFDRGLAFGLVLCFAAAACATNESQIIAAENSVAAESARSAESGDAAEQDVVAEVDNDRVICKRKIVTGSRFPKKVCMTWGEWKALEGESSGLVENIQRRGVQNDPFGGN